MNHYILSILIILSIGIGYLDAYYMIELFPIPKKWYQIANGEMLIIISIILWIVTIVNLALAFK